jgi:hypothetical protein
VEALVKKYEAFVKITRLLEDISREMEASVEKCGTFIKIIIIIEDFFRDKAFKIPFSLIEAFICIYCVGEAFSAMSLGPL